MTSLIASSVPSVCSSTKNSVSLFYTTLSSPNDFLLHYTDDAAVAIKVHNTCISLLLEDHINYLTSQKLQGQKNDLYTYSIELESSKEITSIIAKIQAATNKTFSYYHQLLSSTRITLQQIYFMDSSNSTFHTGLLQLLNSKNIELDTVKQFPLDRQLKKNIREFTSKEILHSEKMAVDLQKKTIDQQEALEESRNVVFGKRSTEKEPSEGKPFYLLQVVSKEQVQLSVLQWFDYFLQTYEENPEHSVQILLDNRKMLLSQICNHIEEGKWKEYNYSQHIPSTLPSLELLFAILQKLYVEKIITNQNILEFLLPIEKNATPTCFIIEKYYYLPVCRSYIYLFSQILSERNLLSEVFVRMNKCTPCEHSSNSSTFLLRLKRAIKSARLDWKFHNDSRGISNLYPLLQALDACRRNDTVSLSQRIAMIFSYDKIPLQKVLQAFYKLENRMKRKDWFPLESEEQISSLPHLKETLQFQKKIYPKLLQECRDKNREAEENRIKQKEKEIADLEKRIEEAENWKPDDGPDFFGLFASSFCTVFRAEDMESIRRKAYSAKQDALREWENWERNQSANRSYEQTNFVDLFAPFAASSSVFAPQKEEKFTISNSCEHPTPSHQTNSNYEDLLLSIRLENLRNHTTPPSIEELTERHKNLRSDQPSTSYVDLEERLQKLRS